jgi:hypothetical protein
MRRWLRTLPVSRLPAIENQHRSGGIAPAWVPKPAAPAVRWSCAGMVRRSAGDGIDTRTSSEHDDATTVRRMRSGKASAAAPRSIPAATQAPASKACLRQQAAPHEHCEDDRVQSMGNSQPAESRASPTVNTMSGTTRMPSPGTPVLAMPTASAQNAPSNHCHTAR